MIAVVLATAILQLGFVFWAILNEANEVFDAQIKQIAHALVEDTPAPTADPVMGNAADSDELDLLIRERSLSGVDRSSAGALFPERMPAGFSEIETKIGTLRVYTAVKNDRDVTVGQRLSARRGLAREIALAALWPLLLLAAIGVGTLYVILHSVLKPVTELESQVDSRDPKSLAPLINPGLPEELAPLLVATNTLISRLSRALEQQKRFLADAAHELRTPISAIALQNVLVTRADSVEERESALRAQSAGIRRASALVDQLLHLSRLEVAEIPLTVIVFEASREISKLVELLRPEVDAKSAHIAFFGRPLQVEADLDLFCAVFGNLVGNAIRHGVAGGNVAITTMLDGAVPTIGIEDDGPGIAEDEVDAMLRPFHRKIEAGKNGTGLGLAIVHAACCRAGWTLQLSRSRLGGLRATVRLGNAPA